MAEVVILAEARKEQPTKQVTYDHGGQRYTCKFDPRAPAGEQWVWYVDYVKTYRYVGSAQTLEKASAEARRKIHGLNRRDLAAEELGS